MHSMTVPFPVQMTDQTHSLKALYPYDIIGAARVSRWFLMIKMYIQISIDLSIFIAQHSLLQKFTPFKLFATQATVLMT